MVGGGLDEVELSDPGHGELVGEDQDVAPGLPTSADRAAIHNILPIGGFGAR